MTKLITSDGKILASRITDGMFIVRNLKNFSIKNIAAGKSNHFQ